MEEPVLYTSFLLHLRDWTAITNIRMIAAVKGAMRLAHLMLRATSSPWYPKSLKEEKKLAHTLFSRWSTGWR